MVERNPGPSRWYDGVLYAWFYDPLEREKLSIFQTLVPEGARVLDLACGTGALTLALAKHAQSVTGVDRSPRMLDFAEKRRARKGVSNVRFVHGDAVDLPDLEAPFDIALASLLLHEIPEAERAAAVAGLARVSRRLILSDFTAPQPLTPEGLFNHALERMVGGAENYRNFRDFIGRGGVRGLAGRLGLNVESVVLDRGGTREYAVLEGLAP